MLTIEVFLATMSTLVVAATAVFLWILSEFRAIRRDNRAEFQKLRDENREEIRATREELREEIRATREELREEIRTNTQRILEALYFHRHDPEGAAVFYPPAPATPAD